MYTFTIIQHTTIHTFNFRLDMFRYFYTHPFNILAGFCRVCRSTSAHIFNIRVRPESCTTETQSFVLTLTTDHLLFSSTILSLCRSEKDIPLRGTSLTILSLTHFFSDWSESISGVDFVTVGAVGN